MNIISFLSRLSHSPISRLAIVMLGALACSAPAFCGEIHDAAKAGDLEKVKILLKANPELVSITDDDGMMPLHRAVSNGHNDVAELLLAHGAEINAMDNSREIFLRKEVMQGSNDTAATSDSVILTKSARARIFDYFANYSSGYTPLHLTAINGMKDMAEFLLVRRADVNARTNAGETPLHKAASFGHKDVVELLLSNKAEINAKYRSGRTPLDEAMIQNHMNIAELLRQHGGVSGDSPKNYFYCSAE
jgi:ankyrin repeat protein